MHIAKLRIPAGNGLVPAGRYFEHLAFGLRDANAEEAARQEKLDAEDRRLEARHRRLSASRARVRTHEHAAAM